MKFSNEAKVGAMITVVILLLAFLTIKSGDFEFSKEGYFVNVHFQNIDGIGLNAPVMLNGLEVGAVKDITISEANKTTAMILHVWLEDQAKIREGADAYVKNMGFLGEKYVGLTSGTPGAPYLKEEAVIIGSEPADMDKLLHDAQVVADQLKEISLNVNERLSTNEDKIDNIFTNLDMTMDNMVSITDNVDERLKVNEKNIDEIIARLRTSAMNMDEFTYDLKMNPWKLLYRSKEQRAENRRKAKELRGETE